MKATTKNKFPKIEKDQNLTGLQVYEVPNVWHIAKDKKAFWFSSIGIAISGRYYKRSEGLNSKYWSKLAIEIQYDYRDPDKLHSMDYEFRGTFGVTKFAKTIDTAIDLCEKYLFENFEGIQERYKAKTIEPKTKISRYELAEIACLHHLAMFDDSKKEDDFTRNMFKNLPKEKNEKLQKLIDKYSRREKTMNKYDDKIRNVFKKTFGFTVEECRHTIVGFSLGRFKKLHGVAENIPQLKEVLKPYELKVLQKAHKRFNY